MTNPKPTASATRRRTEGIDPARRIGLARAISKLGYCSRSEAQELIRSGRVCLNRRIRRDAETPVRLGQDRIEVDRRPLAPANKVYLMLNKPRGVVTTASDEKGRETVYDCLTGEFPWIAPVGRLDKASEGLLLLTNDSEWAARVLAPETHVSRTYHVQVHSVADSELAESLVRGIRARDGSLLKAKDARVLRSGPRNSWLEVTLDEGKNRQVRRMLEELGVEVLRLVRVSIGPLALGDLPKRLFRPLTAEEKHALDGAIRRRSR
jgi:23S rRNA pseudouridine2605 synthase